MRYRHRSQSRSIAIAEILCLLIFAVFLGVLRFQSFATEAIAVYDYAHPTVMEMYISPFDEPYTWLPADTIFIQDTVWRSLAHPAALHKKSASIYEVDCIKIINLHLDGDTLSIDVNNNPLNTESSLVLSLDDPQLPHVLDSLRRIGLQPNVHQLYYVITVSPETVYQNMITLFDEFAQTRKNIPFEINRIELKISEHGAQNYFDKLLPTVKVIKSHDAVKARQENRSSVPSAFGGCGLRLIEIPPPPKPSIPMIFLDYLNPFGKKYLHTERWWL